MVKKKTKAMLFTPRASPAPVIITTLDGTPIEWVDRYKYLVFWLDKHLNFKFHIDSLSRKLKFTLENCLGHGPIPVLIGLRGCCI